MNCKGQHTSYDKTCPRWQKETEIVRTKINNNISFPEARKMIEARSTPASSITYSAVVKSTKSIATQTEIVDCTCHCRVEVVQAQPGTSSTSIQTEGISPCDTVKIVKGSDIVTSCTANTQHIPASKSGGTARTLAIPSSINNRTANAVKKTNSQILNKNIPKTPPSRNATSAGNSPKDGARGVRERKGSTGKSWKDTGSDPDRAPKGSNDPVRSYNRYVSLESMDTIDDIALPPKEGIGVSSVSKTK